MPLTNRLYKPPSYFISWILKPHDHENRSKYVRQAFVGSPSVNRDSLKELEEWCNKNCNGDWGLIIGHTEHFAYFRFTERNDRMIFDLTWK